MPKGKKHGRPKTGKVRPGRSDGSERDSDGYEECEREPYDDPGEHLQIERQRFRGGLPPTPELYARARQQWYRLPGSLARPPMNPVVGDDPPGEQHPPEQAQPEEKRGER
jgi:hypothetical protein